MHIPDGFLDPLVCVSTFAITLVFWVFAFRRTRQILDERQIPLMATLTAMFFAAQMVNYPIIGGTTAHFIGSPLLSITLGPYAGLISMSIILSIQAFFFGDGGLTTFGANVWNMGIVGVFIPYLICLATLKIGNSRRSLLIGAFLGALIGDMLAAGSAGLELGLSVPLFPYSISVALTVMMIHHFFIGLGEGAITVCILSALMRTRPDLLELPRVGPVWMGAFPHTLRSDSKR